MQCRAVPVAAGVQSRVTRMSPQYIHTAFTSEADAQTQLVTSGPYLMKSGDKVADDHMLLPQVEDKSIHALVSLQ